MRTIRAPFQARGVAAPARRPGGERSGDGKRAPEPRRAPKRSLNEAAHKLDR